MQSLPLPNQHCCGLGIAGNGLTWVTRPFERITGVRVVVVGGTTSGQTSTPTYPTGCSARTSLVAFLSRRRRLTLAPNRRIASDRPVYTRTHAPSEASPAIACPASPPYSPVCPNRTNARNLCPRLPSL